jgi:hypothetical protein
VVTGGGGGGAKEMLETLRDKGTLIDQSETNNDLQIVSLPRSTLMLVLTHTDYFCRAARTLSTFRSARSRTEPSSTSELVRLYKHDLFA